MSARRRFLRQAAAGLMAVGAGVRGLAAQFLAGPMMEGPPGTETVIDGKKYL